MVDFQAYEVAETNVVGTIQPNANDAADRLDEAIVEALSSPFGIPSFAQAVVPGDQITFAVLANTDLVAPLLNQVIGYFVDNGIEAADINLLFPAKPREERDLIQNTVEQIGISESQIEFHDPQNDKQLAYLAASDEGLPIVMSRQLTDADVVIPIREAQPDEAQMINGDLFPVFSNSEMIARFAGKVQDEPGLNFQPQRIIFRAMEQLGVFFEIQIVPGAGNRVAEVLAGERSAVVNQARMEAAGMWSFELDAPVDLLIAEPKSEASHVTFREIYQCIRQLETCVLDDGTIVLEADFSNDAGGQSGPDSSDESDSDSHADDQRDEYDSLESSLDEGQTTLLERISKSEREKLSNIIERIHVVVVGEGYDDEVEEQGLGIATSAAKVRRLASRYERCLMIHDALRCNLKIRKDPSDG